VAAASTQAGAAPAATGTPPSSRVQPAASAAAPAAAGQPAAAVIQPVAGSAAETKDSQYQRFEARLTPLRKLRESNLISEKEYQAKRRAILDEL
jgi:hypothetical protein